MSVKIIRIEANEMRQCRRRVVAYCRVSTDRPEQLESYEMQVRHYTAYIGANNEWEFAGIYADPGRSGTCVAKRPNFLKMITDAKARKFDLILTKSISRFARNAADAHKFSHELRDLGVEIYFEKEGISSFSPTDDMIFDLLASVAQDESRSISENVKWRIRLDQEMGIHHLGNGRVLGYDEIDGKLVPNKDAWIVRKIFRLYCEGMSTPMITKLLVEDGVKGQRSKTPIMLSTVQEVLKNEIYTGDRLLQKKAPINYLTKRPDPMIAYNSYYITDDHEPVIDRGTWSHVESMRDARKKEALRGVHSRKTSHVLYGKLFCADCGAVFKRRTLKGKEGSYKAWNCAERQKGNKGNGCKNVLMHEDVLLHEIAGKLNLQIQMDAKTLAEHVKRVEIGRGGININGSVQDFL